jgi:hypothetical protein
MDGGALNRSLRVSSVLLGHTRDQHTRRFRYSTYPASKEMALKETTHSFSERWVIEVEPSKRSPPHRLVKRYVQYGTVLFPTLTLQVDVGVRATNGTAARAECF